MPGQASPRLLACPRCWRQQAHPLPEQALQLWRGRSLLHAPVDNGPAACITHSYHPTPPAVLLCAAQPPRPRRACSNSRLMERSAVHCSGFPLQVVCIETKCLWLLVVGGGSRRSRSALCLAPITPSPVASAGRKEARHVHVELDHAFVTLLH